MSCEIRQLGFLIHRKNLNDNPMTIYIRLFEIRWTIGPSGQKIIRTGYTAKYGGPGVRQNFLFVYFVLHQKTEMQLVCRNDHGQLGIRFCFK